MNIRGTVLAALALLALAVCASDAQAQMGFGGYGWGGGWGGFSYASNPYSLGNIPYPPYFALHPPVSYSYPVSRPYGLSPFAYPAPLRYVFGKDLGAEEIAAPPELIDNPYVEPEKPADAKPAEEATEQSVRYRRARVARRVQPQMVLNPFIGEHDRVAQTSLR